MPLTLDRAMRERIMTENIEEVRLDPFDSERDADLVLTWIHAPHVSRWWGDPAKTLSEVMERPNSGGDAIIVADDTPVGYVRWQKPSREELDAAGLHEISEDTTMDIDIAIGEPEYIGLGVGSRAIELLVKDLVADDNLRMIMLATSVDNLVAIGAYEKAGFERRRRFDDPEFGECWLLTRRVQPV